jgi:hypothetical protein
LPDAAGAKPKGENTTPEITLYTFNYKEELISNNLIIKLFYN